MRNQLTRTLSSAIASWGVHPFYEPIEAFNLQVAYVGDVGEKIGNCFIGVLRSLQNGDRNSLKVLQPELAS